MDWLKLVLKLFDLLRALARWVEGAKQRQAGRDEVTAEINEKTAEKLNEMSKVNDSPTVDDVANSMRNRTF